MRRAGGGRGTRASRELVLGPGRDANVRFSLARRAAMGGGDCDVGDILHAYRAILDRPPDRL